MISQTWRAIIQAALIIVAAVLWARFIEPNLLTVTRRTVEIQGMAQGLDGLRIALVSDLHGSRFGPEQGRLRRILERERPDALIFAGDLVDFERGGLAEGVELLSVMASAGPLAVIWGNHDHEYGLPAIRAALAAAGTEYIDLDETPWKALSIPGRGTLALAGLSRSWLRVFQSVDAPARAARAASLPGSPLIVVMHSPGEEKAAHAAAAGADLIVAGHTHGGQLRVPGLGALWVPGQGLRPQLAWGLHRVSTAWLFVTRGLGTTILPLRFSCPPEVVVLTLRAAPARR